MASGPGGSRSLAKPPDLPVDLAVDLEEKEAPGGLTLGFDLFTGKLSLNLTLPKDLGLPWMPGTKLPTPSGKPGAALPVRATTPDATREPVTLKQLQARVLFEIAERCLRRGDLDKARTCYEEVHLLAPETAAGWQAIQRLADIDNARASAPAGGAAAHE
jgi:hypothetical protein